MEFVKIRHGQAGEAVAPVTALKQLEIQGWVAVEDDPAEVPDPYDPEEE